MYLMLSFRREYCSFLGSPLPKLLQRAEMSIDSLDKKNSYLSVDTASIFFIYHRLYTNKERFSLVFTIHILTFYFIEKVYNSYWILYVLSCSTLLLMSLSDLFVCLH